MPPPLDIKRLTQPVFEPTHTLLDALRNVSSLSRDAFSRTLAHRFEALELVLETETRIRNNWEQVLDSLEGYEGWFSGVRCQEDTDHAARRR
ncbi:hypothetical protein BCR44DRAFT_1427393 [Catenaria anguillulae PL171]|uniref:Uncharacterized protein n=1 Tax=Catenaria anguillulae PL171 TaxID=765915 RepID=A0A1Y2HX95_9FUNG|nr:hypothetical protein BCR44DRAFT_1427393 [Catenaria anguillulae PL171]